jgi:O-antigen ligase
VAGELGILGILTFGALLGTVLWILYRQYAHLRHNTEWSLLLLCMLMMVSGEIFFQLFQTSYYVARLWFPIGVALSAAVLSQRLTQRNERYE